MGFGVQGRGCITCIDPVGKVGYFEVGVSVHQDVEVGNHVLLEGFCFGREGFFGTGGGLLYPDGLDLLWGDAGSLKASVGDLPVVGFGIGRAIGALPALCAIDQDQVRVEVGG